MKKISDILQGAAFAEYHRRAKLGDAINNAIGEALAQSGITARCKALSVNDGELTIAAASPAEAAMLRQVLPALTAALNKAGKTGKAGKGGDNTLATITRIRLRIQP